MSRLRVEEVSEDVTRRIIHQGKVSKVQEQRCIFNPYEDQSVLFERFVVPSEDDMLLLGDRLAEHFLQASVQNACRIEKIHMGVVGRPRDGKTPLLSGVLKRDEDTLEAFLNDPSDIRPAYHGEANGFGLVTLFDFRAGFSLSPGAVKKIKQSNVVVVEHADYQGKILYLDESGYDLLCFIDIVDVSEKREVIVALSQSSLLSSQLDEIRKDPAIATLRPSNFE